MKNALVIIAGRVLQGIAGFVILRALTSMIPATEVGRFYLIVSLVTGATWIAIAPVSSYVARLVTDWNAAGTARRQLTRYGLYVVAAATVGAFVALAADQLQRSGANVAPVIMIVLGLGTIGIGALSTSACNLLNILGSPVRFVAFTNVGMWLGLGTSALLVTSVGRSAEWWLAGQIAGQMIALVLAGISLPRAMRVTRMTVPAASAPGFDARPLFSFAAPVAIGSGLAWVQWQSYRIVVVDTLGPEQLAQIAASYAVVAGIIGAFEAIFSQYAQPILFRAVAGRAPAERAAAWNRYASACVPLVLLVGGAAALAGPYVAQVSLASHYRSTVTVIAGWAALAESLRILGGLYQAGAIVQLTTRQTVVPGVLAAATSLMSIIVFSPYDPIAGTAGGLALGALVYLLISHWIFKTNLATRFPWRDIARAAAMFAGLFAAHAIVRAIVANEGLLQSMVLLAGIVLYTVASIVLLTGGIGNAMALSRAIRGRIAR